MPQPNEAPAEVSAARLRGWPLPEPSSSKRSRGQVLVVGGSPSTPGAVLLAGLAALRVGAGVLSLAVARSIAPTLAVAVPEASVAGLAEVDGGEPDGTLAGALGGSGAVLVGPGLDAPEVTDQILRQVLDGLDDDAAVVLDAFALGVLAEYDDPSLGARTVLTPNGAEAARLLHVDDVGDDDAVGVAASIAGRYGAVVSFRSAVAAPDGRRWIVPTGHAGLGTSGSGDVLAGAAVGLLARGADPDQAACWATFLHATAGDRLAARVGRLGFLARELVDELPLVIVQTEA
jgi:hydroxyethylthiazole kinase-like uncharacterized protein yjeF